MRCFPTLSLVFGLPFLALAEPTQAPPYKPDTPPGVILDHSPPAAGATLRPTWISGTPKGFRDALTMKDIVTVKSCNGETLTASGPIPGHGYREFTLKYHYVPDGKDIRGGWYDGREPQSGFQVSLKFPNPKNDKNQGADYRVIDDSDPKDIRHAGMICALRAPEAPVK